MDFIIENIKRAARERFMLGEAPYHKPTPLISFGSEGTSLEYNRQPARYPLIYILFLIPLE